MSTHSPYLRQLALQGAAAFVALGIVWPYSLFRQQPLSWPEVSLSIGALAFALACLTRQYWWWRLIHALFAPAAVLFSSFSIDPAWYLAACALMFLVYRGALTNQVPLYLSNRETVQTLAALLAEEEPSRKLIDLGAGTGSVVCALARMRPDIEFSGVENSFLPWIIGRLRASRQTNCHCALGSFWEISLTGYDVVYAFLSPAPMDSLWLKVKNEMRPGALFISNSFCVPGIRADHEIDVGDARNTRLYCYRL